MSDKCQAWNKDHKGNYSDCNLITEPVIAYRSLRKME